MSEHNGNGSNGQDVGKSVPKSVETIATMPGRNGGTLRRGGNKTPGPGRPPSVIREHAREGFADLIPSLKRIAGDKETSTTDRLRAIDLLGKYGLGTTVTETDTEGRDVTVRVIREPHRLVGHD
jgi:hypothetical protein